jgi:hypothetical protein
MTNDKKIQRWEDALNVFPADIDYEPDFNYDATNCEFYINGFGRGNFSHGGASAEWLEAYLSVPRQVQEGEVLNVGIWTAYRSCDKVADCFSLGREISTDYWRTGFTFASTIPGSAFDYGSFKNDVLEFAFFIDVHRPSGNFVRLWQSRGGANFTIQEIFVVPGYRENYGVTSIEYADESSLIFDTKRICR